MSQTDGRPSWRFFGLTFQQWLRGSAELPSDWFISDEMIKHNLSSHVDVQGPQTGRICCPVLPLFIHDDIQTCPPKSEGHLGAKFDIS